MQKKQQVFSFTWISNSEKTFKTVLTQKKCQKLIQTAEESSDIYHINLVKH